MRACVCSCACVRMGGRRGAQEDPSVSGLWNLPADAFTAAVEVDRVISSTMKDAPADSPGTLSGTAAGGKGAEVATRRRGTMSTSSLPRPRFTDSLASSVGGGMGSTAGRGAASGASITTGGGGIAPGGAMDSLQQQMGHYILRTTELNAELQEVERQIADLRRDVEAREVSRGGFRAVQENERALQRTEAIMETRLANALVGARRVYYHSAGMLGSGCAFGPVSEFVAFTSLSRPNAWVCVVVDAGGGARVRCPTWRLFACRTPAGRWPAGPLRAGDVPTLCVSPPPPPPPTFPAVRVHEHKRRQRPPALRH